MNFNKYQRVKGNIIFKNIYSIKIVIIIHLNI
jgi:hypothetical protein